MVKREVSQLMLSYLFLAFLEKKLSDPRLAFLAMMKLPS
jgi:hypothetical protein